MKKLAIILAIGLAGCGNNPKVIHNKSVFYYNGWSHKLLPAGICEFSVGGFNPQFQDSCNKYNVGDTLITR